MHNILETRLYRPPIPKGYSIFIVCGLALAPILLYVPKRQTRAIANNYYKNTIQKSGHTDNKASCTDVVCDRFELLCICPVFLPLLLSPLCA